MDRISTLSDDLLLKILSLLRTKDVLSTMFVSKRWKFLWTMVRKLDFEDAFSAHGTSEEEQFDEDKYTRFRQYVDRFLVSHKSPVLDTLMFNIGELSSTDDMATWVRIAIARRVRELEINRFRIDFDESSFILPACLYTFENLVVLKLYKSIVVDVPDDFEVSLSSLKTLHLLSVEYRNEESHRRLLRGCPVLEELVVDQSENWPVPSLSIIMPSLERLSILNEYQDDVYTAAEQEGFHNHRVTIKVPSLKYLNYVDIIDFGHLCLSEDMPEVVEANVKLICKSPEKLMRSLTSVKRLSLCLHGSTLQHRIGFYQLVYLELCGCTPKWWDLLTWILESSPKLQVLKLNKCEKGFHWSIKPIEGRWGQLSSVPECLLFHLHTFEWNNYNGRREEKKLVAYILRTAKRLKTAKISARSLRSEEGSQKLKELASLHRASKSCKLLLGRQTKGGY